VTDVIEERLNAGDLKRRRRRLPQLAASFTAVGALPDTGFSFGRPQGVNRRRSNYGSVASRVEQDLAGSRQRLMGAVAVQW
jgi:hypothetical protein